MEKELEEVDIKLSRISPGSSHIPVMCECGERPRVDRSTRETAVSAARRSTEASAYLWYHLRSVRAKCVPNSMINK